MITHIGTVKGTTQQWLIGDGNAGQVTLRLREELKSIQAGQRPDPHDWMHKIV